MTIDQASAERLVREVFGAHEDEFISRWNELMRQREEARQARRPQRPTLYRDWSEVA